MRDAQKMKKKKKKKLLVVYNTTLIGCTYVLHALRIIYA